MKQIVSSASRKDCKQFSKFQFVGEFHLKEYARFAVAFSLSSAGQYLVFVGSDPFLVSMDLFRKKIFRCFVGSDPLKEGMDLFWKGLFVNNL